MKDKKNKWFFILFAVFAVVSVFFFLAMSRSRAKSADVTVLLIGGIVCLLVALTLGVIGLIRFLRKRSITSGLFLTTTVATLVYFVSSQLVAMPVAPVAAAGATMGGAPAAAGMAIPMLLMQIGLFAVWFLFLLLTIYIYIRPIKRIDNLLTQIIEGKDIEKVRVGKVSQYQGIEQKLQVIATEKQKKRDKAKARAEKKSLLQS